jgi:hypothetical protein
VTRIAGRQLTKPPPSSGANLRTPVTPREHTPRSHLRRTPSARSPSAAAERSLT